MIHPSGTKEKRQTKSHWISKPTVISASLRNGQILNPSFYFQLMSGNQQFQKVAELCKAEHCDGRKRGTVGKDKHHRQKYH